MQLDSLKHFRRRPTKANWYKSFIRLHAAQQFLKSFVYQRRNRNTLAALTWTSLRLWRVTVARRTLTAKYKYKWSSISFHKIHMNSLRRWRTNAKATKRKMKKKSEEFARRKYDWFVKINLWRWCQCVSAAAQQNTLRTLVQITRHRAFAIWPNMFFVRYVVDMYSYSYWNKFLLFRFRWAVN